MPRALVTLDTVRELARQAGLEEGTSYGTPGWKHAGKLVARALPDPDTLVVKCDAALRDELIAAEPDTYFLTDHYVKHPWVLVRLSQITKKKLAERLAYALTVERPPKG